MRLVNTRTTTALAIGLGLASAQPAVSQLSVGADVGIGGSSGVSADVDVGLGGSSGVSAGADVGVGGSSGSGGVSADVDASIGGSGGGSGSGDGSGSGGSGSGSGGSGSGGSGTGSGTGSGSGTGNSSGTNGGTTGANSNSAMANQAAAAPLSWQSIRPANLGFVTVTELARRGEIRLNEFDARLWQARESIARMQQGIAGMPEVERRLEAKGYSVSQVVGLYDRHDGDSWLVIDDRG